MYSSLKNYAVHEATVNRNCGEICIQMFATVKPCNCLMRAHLLRTICPCVSCGRMSVYAHLCVCAHVCAVSVQQLRPCPAPQQSATRLQLPPLRQTPFPTTRKSDSRTHTHTRHTNARMDARARAYLPAWGAVNVIDRVIQHL